MAEGAACPAGGLRLEGTVLARRAIVNRESGEVRGYSYRVLAGADVHDLNVWDQEEPYPVGVQVGCRVRVTAFVRRGGGPGWTLVSAER